MYKCFLYLYLMKWVGDSDMKINGIGLTKINYNDEIIKVKHRLYTDESFWNNFASRMNLPNIFQNGAIYSFKYFVLNIMVIPGKISIS